MRSSTELTSRWPSNMQGNEAPITTRLDLPTQAIGGDDLQPCPGDQDGKGDNHDKRNDTLHPGLVSDRRRCHRYP